MNVHQEMLPVAGQALLALLPGSDAPLRTTLYPTRIYEDGFTTVEIPSPDWSVGSQVDLHGPIGRGFSPPPLSRRWLLVAVGNTIDRLLPLINVGLSKDIAIAVWTDTELPELPAPVEIATSAAEVIPWADYLAIDLKYQRKHEAARLLGMDGELKAALNIDVLFDLDFACGQGVCSVCALREGRDWKLACQDGPVFNADRWIW